MNSVRSGSVGTPIVFDLTPADVRQARRALRRYAYGKGFNPFIVLGLAFALNFAAFALQPAMRFARYGYRDSYAWAIVALEIVVIGLGTIAILVLLNPRTRRVSVTIGDAGIAINRNPKRTSKTRPIPWKNVRALYVFDDLLLIASGLRTTILPKRVLSDVPALETFVTEKLTGARYLSLGSGRREAIVNTSSR